MSSPTPITGCDYPSSPANPALHDQDADADVDDHPDDTMSMTGVEHTVHAYQTQSISAPVVPMKRGRGRPKGSTTKKFLTLPPDGSIPLPTKRPVGRPRKDGLPPGSMNKFKSDPSFQYSAVITPMQISQMALPAYTGPGFALNPQPLFTTVPRPLSTTSAAPTVPVPPESSTSDDWLGLYSQNPNNFLASLILSLFAPNPTSIGGQSVEEAFQFHLLSPNIHPPAGTQHPQHVTPTLYSTLKSFWLPSSPAYFSLTASASTGRTPSEHRFFYWDPLPLVFNGMACPHCATPLANKGRISSGPIKIYDIDKPFFIIGCEYTCLSPSCLPSSANNGGRRFASTDATILRLLPKRLLDEFPAKLVNGDNDRGTDADVWNWSAQGVSIPLWNMVVGGLKAGIVKTQLLAQVQAVRHGTSSSFTPPLQNQAQAQQNQVQSSNYDQQRRQGHESDSETEVERQIERPSSSLVDAQNQQHLHPQQQQQQQAAASSSTSPKATPTPAPQGHPASLSQPLPPHTPPKAVYAPYPFASYSYLGFNMVNQTPPGPPPTEHQQQMQQGQPSSENHLSPTPPSQATTATLHSTPSQQTGQPPASSTHIFSSNAPPSHHAHNTLSSILGGGVGPNKRTPRHCCKCGSQACPGKAQRSYCKNACQDCGKTECKGRNSKRPEKSCAEGWA